MPNRCGSPSPHFLGNWNGKKISSRFRGCCENALIQGFETSPHLIVWILNPQTLLCLLPFYALIWPFTKVLNDWSQNTIQYNSSSIDVGRGWCQQFPVILLKRQLIIGFILMVWLGDKVVVHILDTSTLTLETQKWFSKFQKDHLFDEVEMMIFQCPVGHPLCLLGPHWDIHCVHTLGQDLPSSPPARISIWNENPPPPGCVHNKSVAPFEIDKGIFCPLCPILTHSLWLNWTYLDWKPKPCEKTYF